MLAPPGNDSSTRKVNDPLAATLVPVTTEASTPTLLPEPGPSSASPPIPSPAPSSATDVTLAAPAPMHIAAPTGAGFEEETRRLLHSRLKAIHAAGCLVMAGLVCMNLLGDSLLPEGTGLNQKGRSVFWIAFIATFAGTMFLWRRPQASLQTLRTLELTLFFFIEALGSAVRYNVLSTHHLQISADPRYTDLFLRYGAAITNLPFMFAVLFYGVLIPNTRQRSLIVVGILCSIPLAVTGLAALRHPGVRPSLEVILPLTAMNVFMAGVIAVASAARNQTLRREVYEAKREARHVGPYVLTKKLGAGGMGEVYLAEHKLLKRPCAVKFIRPDLAANPANALRFEREVRAMTTLTHFNTVRIYDYGRTEDGAFYYVMEYLQGPTLETLIREHGPLDPARAVYLLRQVCGALAEAHRAGLVHRDLKPGNILVAEFGGQFDVAKLLDFGLVQDLGAADSDPKLTQTGTIMGTPAYMSPEQAGGDAAIDARGDIYSLGAVAFFALTGRPVFEGESIGRLLAAHLTQAPPLLTEVRKSVPADLARVIDRCLAKAPADRYQSASELETALAGCGCASEWSAAQAAAWWSEREE